MGFNADELIYGYECFLHTKEPEQWKILKLQKTKGLRVYWISASTDTNQNQTKIRADFKDQVLRLILNYDFDI